MHTHIHQSLCKWNGGTTCTCQTHATKIRHKVPKVSVRNGREIFNIFSYDVAVFDTLSLFLEMEGKIRIPLFNKKKEGEI